MNTLITLFSFILTLGILITIHEWGHFIVAKKLGVKVLRFSIGFGKAIWQRTAKDGTEYRIAMIPLGGYVKMLDEREGAVPEQQLDMAFNRKSVGKRMLIVLAGPLANFIFAMLAFSLVYTLGMRDFAPIIDTLTLNSPAEQMGLQVGDEIIAVNQQATHNQQTIRRIFLEEFHSGDNTITVKRQDGVHALTLPNAVVQEIKDTPLDEHFFSDLGFTLAVPAIIGEVEKDSPASLAGLEQNDRILMVNQQPLSNWFDFVQQIAQHPGEKMTLSVLRNTEPLELSIVPGVKQQGGQEIGYIGVRIAEQSLRTTKLPIYSAAIEGVIDTWFYSLLTLESIFQMITGQIGLEHLSGPISIAIYAGNSIQSGLVYFLQFLAFLSISLAVINLLPIPMLDGGHLLYYVVEVLRGKPLSPKAQQIGLSVGLMVLILLMTLAFYNDVIQLSMLTK